MKKTKKITAKEYEKAVGCQPEHDDLDRCNCAKAGEVGHWSCGWCKAHDQPRARCGCSCEPEAIRIYVGYGPLDGTNRITVNLNTKVLMPDPELTNKELKYVWDAAKIAFETVLQIRKGKK